MKQKRIIVGLVIIATILCACETNEPTNPNCGTIKFSWKANGTYFEGNSNYHFLPSAGGHHSFGFSPCSNGTINNPSLSIRLKDPIQVGTYSLMDINDADSPFEGDGSYLDGTGSGYFGTDSTHLGTLSITTFASDSSITGTFSYSAQHSTSSAVMSITEGTFTAIPW